ncbi:MAG TPA: anti-sigma factor domain-containing protein [Clostridia bacterium]|nr:anti-sigma factor domain-containing protein [Clostridia bacterium]
MKAIVAEIDKKHMIVITDKGDFVRIKRQMSAAIGDEIEFKARRTYPAYKRMAPIAACFLACIFLSTGVYAYYTPYSYVSVDINPSIAMSLNRFERVIAVEPITEDAADFIKNTENLKNRQVDQAISTIIKSASEKGYIDEKEETQVMVVVSAEDPKQEKKLAGELDKAASKELSKVNKSSGVTVEKTSVENYKAAVMNKQSPGMEILADKLRKVNPEIGDEEIKDMTVKEAVQRINESKKAAKTPEKTNKREDGEKAWKEALEDKKIRNAKSAKEAAKAWTEDKGDKKESSSHGRTAPAAPSKDENMKAAKEKENNRPGFGNKDKEAASDSGKASGDHNGAGWNKKSDNKDRDDDRNRDKDTDKDKDKEKEGGKNKKDDDKDSGQKDKGNGKDGSKNQKSKDLKDIMKEMMKKIKR